MDCSAGSHAIRIYPDGAIDLSDHTKNRIPFKILAQEYFMGDDGKLSCQALVAAILARETNDIDNNPFNKWLDGTDIATFREIAYEATFKRLTRKDSKKFIDPFGTSLRYRMSYVLAGKAAGVLWDCTFRTTTTYHHKVSVVLTDGKTSFKGSGIDPKKYQPDGTKKCSIRRRSFIEVHLNPRRWAKVFLFCGGYVDEVVAGNPLRHFIYEINKVKSENELYVHIMKQSRGYTLRKAKAVIRCGHDGVWRIHDWPKVWP